MMIIKRDGRRQKYDPEKVYRAVAKCLSNCPLPDDDTTDLPSLIRDAVNAEIGEREDDVSVEEIQDIVEFLLMEYGYHEQAKHYILYRAKRTELRKKRLIPDSSAISQYIHPAKYARYVPELMRRETFEETVERVRQMHLKKYPFLGDEIDFAFNLVRQKKVLPSLRTMQFAGVAAERDNARVFNCSFSFFDRPGFLKEALYLLLCGCGVGVSVQKHHVSKLPPLGRITLESPVVHHHIEDSIEGWANAVDILFDSYINSYYVEFDYSAIRDRGKPLKTSGGRAPGHRGLKRSLEAMRAVFDEAQGRQLRPFECYRLVCLMADSVLSGGIRRSSCITLFSADDDEMITCKTGNWFEKYPEFANSNNSVILVPGETSRELFHKVITMAKEWGEPGFFFSHSLEYGVNPCQPGFATVLVYDEDKLKAVPLSDIKVGDKIFSSFDSFVKVVSKEYMGKKFVYRYRYNDAELLCTAEHQVVTDFSSDYAFVWKKPFFEAESLIVCEDKLNKLISVDRSAHEPYTDTDVYDITVDGRTHTYNTGLPDTSFVVSNCGEALLIPYLNTEEGRKTGFSMCNLTEINAAAFKGPEDMMEAARAAAILGTLQAGYIDMPFLGDVTEKILLRDSLLGVSMTGMMEVPELAFDPELQREAARVVLKTNEEIVDKMRAHGIPINYAARCTCVKPSGTASLELGIGASGIHPAHAHRYIRRVTANPTEPVFQYFKSINPHMCVQKPNGDWVIEFPVMAKPGAIVKEDLSAIEFLKKVLLTQENWVRYGTRTNSDFPGAEHGVSNTVFVKQDEWGEVEQFIWDHQSSLRGVSLFPSTGDKEYAFAPMQAIVTEDDENRWNYLVRGYPPVDYSKMVELEDNSQQLAEVACTGGKCDLTI